MNKSILSIIRSTLAVTTLAIVSTNSYGVNAVTVQSSTDWDLGANHIMNAGGSISASSISVNNDSYIMNHRGHFGRWYTFMTHEVATTTISATATDTAQMSPGFTVWKTNGEFDGGVGSTDGTGELSSDARTTPHSFNQVGSPGDYGTWWMTDDSQTISNSNINDGAGYSTNGITDLMGYSNDGPYQPSNDWGEEVFSDNTQDGKAQLTLTDLAAGWYLVFIGGADSSLTGATNITLNVSSVPVPAALYLFSSALVGLFASSHRKSANHRLDT